MACSITNNTVQGETFLPGQIFVFGSFALRANSLGHLEQIDSYAPGHQIRFGNLNYTADVHGDLIFDGLEPVPGAPDSHDEHGLDLLSDNARNIIPAVAPDLNPEQVALPKDGGVDPAPQATGKQVWVPPFPECRHFHWEFLCIAASRLDDVFNRQQHGPG